MNKELFESQYLQQPPIEGDNRESRLDYKKYRHRQTGKIVEAKFGDYFTSDGRQNLYFVDDKDVKPRYMAPEWFNHEYEALEIQSIALRETNK